MADTNTLTDLITSQTTGLLDNCDTACVTGSTQLTTDQIEDKTELIEDIMDSLSDALKAKETELNLEVETKFDVVQDNRESLQIIKNSIN